MCGNEFEIVNELTYLKNNITSFKDNSIGSSFKGIPIPPLLLRNDDVVSTTIELSTAIIPTKHGRSYLSAEDIFEVHLTSSGNFVKCNLSNIYRPQTVLQLCQILNNILKDADYSECGVGYQSYDEFGRPEFYNFEAEPNIMRFRCSRNFLLEFSDSLKFKIGMNLEGPNETPEVIATKGKRDYRFDNPVRLFLPSVVFLLLNDSLNTNYYYHESGNSITYFAKFENLYENVGIYQCYYPIDTTTTRINVTNSLDRLDISFVDEDLNPVDYYNDGWRLSLLVRRRYKMPENTQLNIATNKRARFSF